MNTFNPITSISSRYSTVTISASTYQQFTTGTTTPILIGNKGINTLQPGIVFAPYIMADIIDIGDWRELQRKYFREKRKEKLEKLGWKNILKIDTKIIGSQAIK